ncbi:MAG: metallophosphoesterase family protein [Planctomycetota bacterium]|jgi:predicted phosphodiesterase
MNGHDLTRRDFLRICGITAAASAIGPAARCRAAGKPLVRFAVASDIHYGQKKTPFADITEKFISWMNDERKRKGLDAVFLNGDIVHDSLDTYEALKSKYLKRLDAPYYAVKGNHDFVDGKPGSPTQSWERIWGHPADHVIKIGKLAFILADTTALADAGKYLAAHIGRLGEQLDSLKDAEGVFVFMHIAQRKRDVEGWPKWGLKDARQVEAGEAVMAMLESRRNVRAVFHGHNHNETGRYVSGGKPYFFDSHVGGSFGNRKGYRIVEVHAGGKISTYQLDAESGKVMNSHSL